MNLELDEANKLMSTVSDPVRVFQTIDGLIPHNEADKNANEEKTFMFLEMENPEFLNIDNGIKAGVEIIESDALNEKTQLTK